MKKIIIGLALVAVLMSGCAQHETEKNQQEENMLMVIDNSMSYRIYVDKETMVMYLRTKQGYGEALCVMVDADGKPLLWKGEQQ